MQAVHSCFNSLQHASQFEPIMEPTTGIEPVNLFLTKEVLYLLSYVGPATVMTIISSPVLSGAGNGTRTRDVQLGRLTLYQLSYSRMMVEGGGFEPPKAEPTDLQSAPFGRSGTPPLYMEPAMGLEPATC